MTIPPLPPPDIIFRTVRSLDEIIAGALAAPTRRVRSSIGPGAVVTAISAVEAPLLAEIAIAQTMIAALLRGRPSIEERLAVLPEDLRRKIWERRRRWSILMVIDGSSSMRRGARMSRVKALLRDIVTEAHRFRYRAAIVSFRHDRCELLVPFTFNSDRLEAAIEGFSVGGRTPLAEGLSLALRTLIQEHRVHPETSPFMLVISDGRPNLSHEPGGDPYDEALSVAAQVARAKIPLAFVDSEDDPMASGCGQKVSEIAGGSYEFLTRIIGRVKVD